MDPLVVYIFDSFLIKLEAKEWSTDSEKEVATRLNHPNKHRYGSAKFLEEQIQL